MIMSFFIDMLELFVLTLFVLGESEIWLHVCSHCSDGIMATGHDIIRKAILRTK